GPAAAPAPLPAHHNPPPINVHHYIHTGTSQPTVDLLGDLAHQAWETAPDETAFIRRGRVMPLNQRQIADVYHALTQHPDATFGAVYDWIRYTYADLLPYELLILHQQYHQTINAPTLSSLDFSRLPSRTFLYMAAVEQIHREHGTIAGVSFNATVTVFGEDVQIGRWLSAVRNRGENSTIPGRQPLLNELTRLGMRWERLPATTSMLMEAVRLIYRERGTIANFHSKETVNIRGRELQVGRFLTRLRRHGSTSTNPARLPLLNELTRLGMHWEKSRESTPVNTLLLAARQIYMEKGTIANVRDADTVRIGDKEIAIGRWLTRIRSHGRLGATPARQGILDVLDSLGMIWVKKMTPTNLLMDAVRRIYREKGTIADVSGVDTVKMDGRDIPVGDWLNKVRSRGRTGLTGARKDLVNELTRMGMEWGSRRTGKRTFVSDDEMARAVTKFYSSNPKGRITRTSLEGVETADNGQKAIPFGKMIYDIVRTAKKDRVVGGVPEAVYEILKRNAYPEIAHLKPRPPRATRMARGGALAPGPGRAAVDRGPVRWAVSDGGDVVSSVVLVRLKGSTD
ncbi:hypothetical protein AB0F07_40900, partial [Streptomyces fructofermentans]|uniref:hypothetical protein n=1 Tax=Streptomyces fructofermentans TaxID=152141 RepID=UPI0033CE4EA9